MKVVNLLVCAVVAFVFKAFDNAVGRLPGGAVAALMASAFLITMLGVWYAARFLADMLSNVFA